MKIFLIKTHFMVNILFIIGYGKIKIRKDKKRMDFFVNIENFGQNNRK